MKTVIRTIVMVLCLMVMCVSSVLIMRSLYTYFTSAKAYQQAKEFVQATSITHEVIETPAEEEAQPAKTIDFPALQAINPEIFAWVEIAGTRIDYPVAQAKNNDFYLNHLYDLNKNAAGCPFLDYRCATDFTSPISAIYGHCMKDGSMFAPLMQYKKSAEFYKEHPEITVYTPNGTKRSVIFAGTIGDGADDLIPLSFSSEEERMQFLNKVQKQSTFQTDIELTQQDRVLALCTCAYDFDNARYIIWAKWIEE